MSKAKFLNLLFDDGQKTCFTSSPKGTKVLKYPYKSSIYFSINALHPTEDLAPSMPYHSPSVPRRADANVICFRNFLIEIDNMPLDKQVAYVRGLLPVSSIVYSGGKSYHFIVSLQEPCEDYLEYMQIAEQIAQRVPNLDPACRNPSRLSRLPNVMRPDTGKSQELLYVGRRIAKSELLEILPKVKYNYEVTPSGVVSKGGKRMVPSEVIEAVKDPAEYVDRFGGRNQFFFWLGNRLREVADSSEDFIYRKVNQAYDRLPNQQGFPIQEAYTAARISRCKNYDLG